MTWVVPIELEDAVYDAVRAELGDAALATAALRHAIIDRSKRYTSDRDRLAAPADPRGDLAARAAFFTIADAIKIAIPLGELAGRGAMPAGVPDRGLRIVDLGAGCGAMTLGIVAATKLAALDIVAIDRDAAALRIADHAIRGLGRRRDVGVAVATRTGDVATASIPRCDLVVIGSVLNELVPDARVALIERALAAIGDDGAVIVVEPALRAVARAVHELRDAVIARSLAAVFAPCTRTLAPCPALRDADDWCHEDRPVQLPPRTAELARLTHLRDGGLKMAYLVLRRAPLPLVASVGAWRVVSAAMPAKGKLEIYGCSDAGRVPIRLLKRNRSDANRELERAHRGDVLVIERALDAAADERVEVGRETTVTRIEPANSSDAR
jgi:ribosomal protein RSM22 (predicted rRNA methylase)